MEKIKAVAVLGPTASGKSDIAIGLAKHYKGEIVSCDSMQIYKELDIGTAKPSQENLQEVPHHLIGFLNPALEFSVSEYVELAMLRAREICKRGRVSIIAGGTGMYARSLLSGVTFDGNERSDEIRREIEQILSESGKEYLYSTLTERDPEAAKKIHPNNVKRVIRALEYIKTTGKLFSSNGDTWQVNESPFIATIICLMYRDRQKLYERINRRVDLMLEMGLEEEARRFYEKVKCAKSGGYFTASQAIGYKELFSYFRGEATITEAVELLKKNTRNYAKRQITWFKREKNAKNVYIDDFADMRAVLRNCIDIIGEDGHI